MHTRSHDEDYETLGGQVCVIECISSGGFVFVDSVRPRSLSSLITVCVPSTRQGTL